MEIPRDTTGQAAQVAGSKSSSEDEPPDTRLRFGMFEVAPLAVPQPAGLGAWSASRRLLHRQRPALVVATAVSTQLPLSLATSTTHAASVGTVAALLAITSAATSAITTTLRWHMSAAALGIADAFIATALGLATDTA